MNKEGEEEDENGEEDTRVNTTSDQLKSKKDPRKEAPDAPAPAELSDEEHSEDQDNDKEEFMLVRMFREEFEEDDDIEIMISSDDSDY
jgi:hypothetical protein